MYLHWWMKACSLLRDTGHLIRGIHFMQQKLSESLHGTCTIWLSELTAPGWSSSLQSAVTARRAAGLFPIFRPKDSNLYQCLWDHLPSRQKVKRNIKLQYLHTSAI